MAFSEDVRIGCLPPYVGVPRTRLRLHFLPFRSGYFLRTLEVGSVLRAGREYANALLFNHGARGEAVQHIYILGGMWGDDCRKTGWLKLFRESLSSVKPKDVSISRFIRFDGIHVQGYGGDPRTLLQMGSGKSRVKRRLALGVVSLGVPLALLQRPADGLEILLIRGFKVGLNLLSSGYDFIGLSSSIIHLPKLAAENKKGDYPNYGPGFGKPDSRTLKSRHACFDFFFCLLQLLLGCWMASRSVSHLGFGGKRLLWGIIALLGGCLLAIFAGYFLIRFVHDFDTVPQKYHLTSSNYWGTVIAIKAVRAAIVQEFRANESEA